MSCEGHIYIYLFHVCVSECRYVHHVHPKAWGNQKTNWIPWKWSPDPLKKQQVLLTLSHLSILYIHILNIYIHDYYN